MNACMHVFMGAHACVDACMCVCMHTCMFTWTFEQIYSCMDVHACMHFHACTYICTHVFMRAYMHVQMYSTHLGPVQQVCEQLAIFTPELKLLIFIKIRNPQQLFIRILNLQYIFRPNFTLCRKPTLESINVYHNLKSAYSFHRNP